MKAAVLMGPNRVRIEQVEIPEPGEGAVRVRLEGCGVCGSDLVPWEGRPGLQYPFPPGQPGHEGWGEVDAAGPNAPDFKVGERVAMLSHHAFAEYDVARENSLVRLPASMNKQPFPGKALAGAMNIFQQCEIKPAQTVAIVGIGFLGAILTSLAARAGAFVIAISRRPFALDIARHFGSGQLIELEDNRRVIERVKFFTEGLGCERVVEAVGQQGPLDLATELTAERGRLIIAGDHQDGPGQVNVQKWNRRGIDVVKANKRDPKVYHDGLKAAVDAISRGELDPAPLYTHIFAMDEISSVFASMRERPQTFMKGLITL